MQDFCGSLDEHIAVMKEPVFKGDTWSWWAWYITVHLITDSWMIESMNTPSVQSPVVLF